MLNTNGMLQGKHTFIVSKTILNKGNFLLYKLRFYKNKIDYFKIYISLKNI